MPDHDNTSILNRQTKKRRVDIGMKRTFDTMSVNFDQSKVVVFNDMNAHGPEHDVECSMVQHTDSEKSNVLRKLLKQANSVDDTVIPFPGATIISHLIKNSLTKNGASEPKFQNNHFSSTDSEIHQEDACSTSSQGSPQGYMSPFSRPSVAQIDIDRLTEEHLKAKRARVESIIRGMSHSPSVALRSGENECALQPSSPRESYRENKRKQKLPQQQQQEQQQSFQHHVSACKVQKHEEHQQLKLQLEDMQKQLRQLQEKFYQIYDSTDSENDDVWNLTEESLHSDGMDNDNSDQYHSDNEISVLNPGHFLNQTQALFCKQIIATEKDKHKQDGSQEKGQIPTSMYAEGKRLAEMLKQELNTAMSQVVDTVVKVFVKPPYTLTHEFSSVQMPREHFVVSQENTHFPTANQRMQCFGIIPNPLNSFGSVQVSSPNDQTEALPLVVRKNSPNQTGPLSTPGGHHHPGLHPSPLSTNMALSSSSFHHPFPLHLMGYPLQSPLVAPHESFPGKEKSPESVDQSKETNSLRIKMSSNHLRPVTPPHPANHEGLSLSLIKSECRDFQDISDISPYSGTTIQEGLSPNHLKKAKLMFFYTRYPSSNMLKMFFPDVKFNRCITSQLIKWFSNFREFYYIQMEKFARHAIDDGVTGAEELMVSRDCELYRALNMHYNKSNDFEVPEHFLDVAQITLREFFNAIVAGKDVDPSWKKAIYKIICKLDSEVPEIFKSPSCLQELLHE